MLHLLAKARAQRMPVLRADVRFESGRQQRAHRREHGLAAVHGNVGRPARLVEALAAKAPVRSRPAAPAEILPPRTTPPVTLRRSCFVMNSAAVLARAGYSLNRYLQLLRWDRRPSLPPNFSAKIPWGAHVPVATLQHLVNLQAHFPSVKESAACAKLPAIQLLLLRKASVNSEDAFTPSAGWLDRYAFPSHKNSRFFLGCRAPCSGSCLRRSTPSSFA